MYNLLKLNAITKEYYNSYCKKVRNKLLSLKTKYFINKMDGFNVKTQWSNLNTLLNNKKSKNTDINSIKIDNNIVENKKDICNHLNNYFTDIGTTTSNSIPIIDNCSFKDFMGPANVHTFSFFNISPEEVRITINNFKNKTCNINEIPIDIYKKNIRFNMRTIVSLTK